MFYIRPPPITAKYFTHSVMIKVTKAYSLVEVSPAPTSLSSVGVHGLGTRLCGGSTILILKCQQHDYGKPSRESLYNVSPMQRELS